MNKQLISYISEVKNMSRLKKKISRRFSVLSNFKGFFLLLFVTGIFSSGELFSQTFPASPANWLYPEGNSEGTKYTRIRSNSQIIDSFKVKWSTPSISGDVQPLIGNIINNNKIFSGFRWAPNEIAAIMGGKIVIVDATGKTHKVSHPVPYVKGFSILFDSTQTGASDSITKPLVLGIETVEYENHKDSLAFAYLGGFDHNADTVAILQRLAIDLRDYAPNIFASIRPVFGRREDDGMNIYATINMSQPTVTETDPVNPPYLRGFTQFNTGIKTDNYPLPDVGDEFSGRIEVGPEVSFAQPSITKYSSGETAVILPFYESPSYDVRIQCSNIDGNDITYGNDVYVLGFNISSQYPEVKHGLQSLKSNVIDNDADRPQVRPYFVNLTNGKTGGTDKYIIYAEEYRGIDGSNGQSKLHLFDAQGGAITWPNDFNYDPPYYGNEDHLWSVAVGNVDGNSSNSWLPYYPNYPDEEIIVTYSSRDFAVASSKLCVLRYYSDYIEKPTPPNSFLNTFDTVVTQRINGWVAAVNDIDNGSDGKDEIIIADGSKLRILKLRNYASFEFRSGYPFDTLLTIQFDQEAITNVAVADLEGDGLNDIIVTTNDSTYVIGSEIENIIDVTYPDVGLGTVDYCPGDEVEIKWDNIIRGSKFVNIKYQKLNNNIETGDPELIVSDIDNWADSVTYTITVDESLIGTEGYFIVESTTSPDRIYDRTAKLRFNYPVMALDPLPNEYYHSGESVVFTGTSLCVDSITIEYGYRYDEDEWNWLWSEDIYSDGNFSITAEMPCAEFFESLLPDEDSIINLRIISSKADYKDTTDNIPVKLRPAPFPVEFDACTSACKSREFRWDIADIDFPCDEVTIALDNGSSTFSLMETVPVEQGSYMWHVPLNVPECVYIRFTCENSCVRLDTLVDEFGQTKPKYIDIVAPNPFNPPMEEVEVIYQVPSTADVTIRVFDQKNRMVAELEKEVPRKPGIAYCARWAGTRWDGAVCDNGMYYICIELSSGSKEVYPVFVRKL